jgi:hypothetical protein
MADKKEEITLEAVQAELAKVNEQNVQLLAKIEDYETLKETVERITADNVTLLANNSELKELNGVYFRDIEKKDINIKEALELIAEQQSALSTDDAASTVPVVTFNKKKYQVVVPRFNVDGKEYAAEDLKNNKEVIESLLAKKSGVLVPVV